MTRQTPFQKREQELHHTLRRLAQQMVDAREEVHLAKVSVDQATKDRKAAEVEMLRGLPDRCEEAQQALDAARRAQEAQELRLASIPQAEAQTRREINTLVAENLAEVHSDALRAEETIQAAAATAIEAVDHLAAVAADQLRWLERLRAISHDGVFNGIPAALEGDLDGARSALAALKVRWPDGVDRETGRHASPSQRRQEAFERQQDERAAAWAGFKASRSSSGSGDERPSGSGPGSTRW